VGDYRRAWSEIQISNNAGLQPLKARLLLPCPTISRGLSQQRCAIKRNDDEACLPSDQNHHPSRTSSVADSLHNLAASTSHNHSLPPPTHLHPIAPHSHKLMPHLIPAETHNRPPLIIPTQSLLSLHGHQCGRHTALPLMQFRWQAQDGGILSQRPPREVPLVFVSFWTWW